jgi:hypothetical protein
VLEVAPRNKPVNARVERVWPRSLDDGPSHLHASRGECDARHADTLVVQGGGGPAVSRRPPAGLRSRSWFLAGARCAQGAGQIQGLVRPPGGSARTYVLPVPHSLNNARRAASSSSSHTLSVGARPTGARRVDQVTCFVLPAPWPGRGAASVSPAVGYVREDHGT